MMDNFKFYIGEVKSLSLETLVKTKSDFADFGKKYLLFRNVVRTEKDWYLSVFVKDIGGRKSINIVGSIRKWYFGRQTFRDLTKEDFVNCIDLIGKRLGLTENEIWGAKTMNGEVSLSLILGSDMKFFLNSFVDYKGFEVMRRGNTYLAFLGNSKALKFYNAGRKIWKEKGMTEEKMNWIESHFLRFRVEAKIDDLLRVEKTMGEMLATPGTIVKNWEEIYDYLRLYIQTVECYGISSLARVELNGGSRKDFLNHLLNSGVNFITPELCFQDLKLLKSGKPRSEAKKLLRQILGERGYSVSDKDRFLAYFDKKAKRICMT